MSGRDPRRVVTRVVPAEHGFRVYPPCMSVFLRYGPAAGVSERFRPGGTISLCLAETPDVSRRKSFRPNIDSERPRVDCRLPCRDARWARPDPSSGVRGPCRTSTSRQVTRACRPRVEPPTHFPPASHSGSETDLRPGSRSVSVRAEREPCVWPRPQMRRDVSRSGRTWIPSVPPLHVGLPPIRTCGRGLGAIPSGRNDSADPCRDPRCVTTRVAAAERRFRAASSRLPSPLPRRSVGSARPLVRGPWALPHVHVTSGDEGVPAASRAADAGRRRPPRKRSSAPHGDSVTAPKGSADPTVRARYVT